MKKLLLSVAISSLMIGSAYAGCSGVGDGPLKDLPKVVVCLMNKCDKTIEINVCSNVPDGTWITYGNGVTVTTDSNGKTTAIHQGDHLVPRSQWKTLVIYRDPLYDDSEPVAPSTPKIDWVKITEGNNYTDYYDKKQPSTKMPNGNRAIRILIDIPLPDGETRQVYDGVPTTNGYGTSMIESYEFNCKKKQYRITDDTVFASNMASSAPIKGGSDLDGISVLNLWTSIDGGVMPLFYNLACKGETPIADPTPEFLKTNGHDPHWVKSGQDVEMTMGERLGGIFYYDANLSSPSSKVAIKMDDGYMEMRVLVDMPKTDKCHGSSDIETLEFDCKGKRVRTASDTHYDDNMGRGDWRNDPTAIQDISWRSAFKDYADEDNVLFKLACPLVHGEPVKVTSGEWWNYTEMSKSCVTGGSPEQQIAEYKVHDVNDVTVTYVKNDRGEVMYAKMRAGERGDYASDNTDFRAFITFYHSYHKDGKLLTGQQSCEDSEVLRAAPQKEAAVAVAPVVPAAPATHADEPAKPRWVKIDGNDDTYYDANLSSTSSKAAVKMDNGMMEMTILQNMPNQGISDIDILEFDCQLKSARMISDVTFDETMARGNRGKIEISTGDWRPVSFDENVMVLYKLACGDSDKNTVFAAPTAPVFPLDRNSKP